MTSSDPIRVGIEITDRKSFASALDWPGWARAGRTPAAALDALAAHRDRFVAAIRAAGLDAPSDGPYAVLEELPGDATTAFGAPSAVFLADRAPGSGADAQHLAALVRAAWAELDRVVAVAPDELRKGPRGGGRDRDAIVEHVAAAHGAYLRSVGGRLPGSATDLDRRSAILDVLGRPSDGTPPAGGRWPTRYAARRVAWHALDHAWEIQERSQP